MGRAFGAVPLNLNETLARGDFAGALALIRPLLTARPEDPVLLRLAGHCLARVGRHDESEHHWKQALHIVPGCPEATCGLGELRLDQGDFSAALNLFQSAPSSIRSQLGALSALERSGRLDEAVALVEAHADLLHDGQFAYAAAVALDRAGQPQRALNILQGALDQTTKPVVQKRLWFRIGRILDAAGDHEGAWSAWTNANALLEPNWDPEKTRRTFEAIKAIPLKPGPTPCAATPVFVVGLPRCGSTLLESKLASRHGVTALGEDSSLLRAAHALPGGWPKGAAEFQKSTRPEGWWSESGETTTFVDKNLFNHLVLPFILHVLPNARFIHLRRNQADTLLSCFAEPLPARLHPWTTSPGRLSQYAALHNDLMSHWSKQMPTEQWLEISYESMVQDMDATLRTVGQFAGINVEQQKSTDEATAPKPITISYEQLGAVRTDRSGRGQRYEAWFTR